MTTSPDTIIQLLSVFRDACTQPTFVRLCTLATGAILAPGQRTIASALRAVGLEQAADFSNYHEVFNRARWSPFVMSRLLLGLIISVFISDDEPLMLLIDDTLERRRGRKIKYKSIFRDPVRSTAEYVSLTYGIRWICACVLVQVPWSKRAWALPFFVAPMLSKKRSKALHKQYVSPTQWSIYILKRVRRWFADRPIVLVGDGGYASVELCSEAVRMPETLFVSRLHMNAVLYDKAPAPNKSNKSKPGPKPKKGARQQSFSERLDNDTLEWHEQEICWYGGRTQKIEYASDVSLWHKVKMDPVAIRWVLLRSLADSSEHFTPCALLCTDTEATPEQIIRWFLGRWNIEVTFEEMRACLGFETQRHWSDRAVGRITPCLFGLFSVVVLLAHRLHPHELPVQKSRWYGKTEPSFRDALAAVRMHLWGVNDYSYSAPTPEMCLIPSTLLLSLQRAVAYTS